MCHFKIIFIKIVIFNINFMFKLKFNFSSFNSTKNYVYKYVLIHYIQVPSYEIFKLSIIFSYLLVFFFLLATEI